MSISVEVRGGDIERALRLFKKRVQIDGLLRELRSRRFYEKPSVKKKRKKLEAVRRKRKAMRFQYKPWFQYENGWESVLKNRFSAYSTKN